VGQLDRADPIGDHAIVPDSLKAAGQDMEEKPSEEFDRVERHEALPIAPLIVLPAERHLPIGTSE
jgi:hypothetical protein